MSADYPTFGPQRSIDQAATRLVRGWLEPHCQVRARVPDVFVDYDIEVTTAGEPSGLIVSIQQKGRDGLKERNGQIVQRMKKKHLRYYSEKLQTPLFLLVVDVVVKVGHFLFVQKWLDENMTHAELAGRGTLMVSLPVANRIDDFPALLTAIRDSVRYMREKYPSSVEAAMRDEVAKIKALDSRFDVRMDVIDSKKHFHLRAIEDVNISLRPKTGASAEFVKKLQEMLDYGVPTQFPASQIELSGAPILEKILSEHPDKVLGIDPAATHDLIFEAWTEDDRRLLMQIPGKLTVGKVGFMFSGAMPGGPVTASVRFPKDQILSGGEFSLGLSWNFRVWERLDVGRLPYFESTKAFVDAVASGQAIRHRLVYQGNGGIGGRLGPPGSLELRSGQVQFLNLLDKARAVAGYLKMELTVPKLETINEPTFRDIEYAYAILIEGGFTKSADGISVPIEIDAAAAAAKLDFSQMPLSGGFRMTGVSHRVQLFELFMELQPLTLTFDHASIEVPEKRRGNVAGNQSLRLRVLGSPGSKLTTRLSVESDFVA